jgi:hypothetical protein
VAEACKDCGFGFEDLKPDPAGRAGHHLASVPGFEDEPRSRSRIALVAAVAVLMLCAGALVLSLLVGQTSLPTLGIGESAALEGEGDWKSFRDPTGTYVVDLPGEAVAIDSGDPPPGMVRSQGHGVAFANSQFTVTYSEFDPEYSVGMNAHRLLYDAPHREVEQSGATLLGTSVTTVSGHDAVHYWIEDSEGITTVTAVIFNSRLYFIEVTSDEREPPGFRRMEQSFRFEEEPG